MSLVDELKGLSQHLSPSFKVKASEALDVLSALIQYAEHGSPVIEAGVQGAQAVADFYHEVEVKKASDAGAEAPVKGQPVASAPQAPTSYPGAVPAPGVSAQQFGELVQLVQGLAAAVSAQNRPTAADVTVTSEPPAHEAPTPEPTPEPETAPAPAPAPEPQTNVFG